MTGWVTVSDAVPMLLLGGAYACWMSLPRAVTTGRNATRAFSTAASATTTFRSEMRARSLRVRANWTDSWSVIGPAPAVTVGGPSDADEGAATA